MHRLLPFVLIGLVACAPERTPTPAPAPVPSGADTDLVEPAEPAPPLRATLDVDRTLTEAAVTLSRDGYVALFMWWPGGRARLLYPGDGPFARSWLDGGEHLLRTGAPPRPGFGGTALMGPWGLPAYFALVVSEAPLQLEDVRSDGVRAASGLLGPQATARAIVREVMPDPDGVEWTAAYHVAWPDAAPAVLAGPGDRLRGGDGCVGGVVIGVPVVVAPGVRCRPGVLLPGAPGTPAVPRTATGRPDAAATEDGAAKGALTAPSIRDARPARPGARGPDTERRPAGPPGGGPPR